MMGWYGGFGGMGVGGVLLMVLVWVAVLALIVWAVRALFPGTQGPDHAGPLDVLKRRYAAGEITSAEYEQARRAIE
jgi:putative membrane protein